MTKILAYEPFSTNIKNIPEGEYLTEICGSDAYPWAVVGRTAKTITVREVLTAPDPCCKEPAFLHAQTWLYAGLGKRTVTLRLVKSPYRHSDKLWGHKEQKFIADGARHHYDYDF